LARRKSKKKSQAGSGKPIPAKQSESLDIAEPRDGKTPSLPLWKKILFAGFTCMAFFGILELVRWGLERLVHRAPAPERWSALPVLAPSCSI
jgi:hypothetical protein